MKFLAYSNIFIAFAALSHTVTTYLLFGKKPETLMLLFVFGATLFLYNFIRITKLKNIPSEEHSDQLIWLGKNLKFVTIITSIAFFGTIVLFFFLSKWQMIIVMTTGFIGLNYNFSFGNKQISIRKIPFLKSFIISVVWTCMTLLIPLCENNFILESETFLLRLLFVYVLMIPFDIRDLKYDDSSMKTLPQLFGKTGAVTIGIILLLTCSCLAFSVFDKNMAIILSMSYGITAFVLLLSIKIRNELFYPIVVDGMMIVQGLLVIGAWGFGI